MVGCLPGRAYGDSVVTPREVPRPAGESAGLRDDKLVGVVPLLGAAVQYNRGV